MDIGSWLSCHVCFTKIMTNVKNKGATHFFCVTPLLDVGILDYSSASGSNVPIEPPC